MKRWLSSLTKAIALALLFSPSAYTQSKNNHGKQFYTVDEVKRMCGVPVDPEEMKRILAKQDSMYAAYMADAGLNRGSQPPPNWHDLMSDVDDQGSCRDCWAHAATGMTEGQLQILYGSRIGDNGIDLDELDIVDNSAHSGGCEEGDLPTTALAYIQSSKAISEVGSYPNLQGTRWDVVSYSAVTGISQIKTALGSGPVTACFQVYSDFGEFFYYHPQGVYTHSGGGNYDGHAVVIVSYDDNNQYWLCKNSWGDWWADGGYFRIGYGQCAIESWQNIKVTVDQSCYAKIAPDLMSFGDAMSSGFGTNEWAYVFGTTTSSSNGTIPGGSALQTSSGSTISFTGNYKLRIEGKLFANGTTFTRSGGQWYGIEFYNGNSGSSVQNCTIENAQYGVYSYGTDAYLSGNTLRNNSTGAYVYASPTSMNWNLFENNTYGVQCAYYGDANIQTNNVFRYNGWAIYGDAYSVPSLGSYIGYNSLYWTDYFDIYSAYGGTIYARGNWWGSYPANPSIIGNVDYSGELTFDPNSWAGAAGKVAGNGFEAGTDGYGGQTGILDDTTGVAELNAAYATLQNSDSLEALSAFRLLLDRHPGRLAGSRALVTAFRLTDRLQRNGRQLLEEVIPRHAGTRLSATAKLLLIAPLLGNSSNSQALGLSASLTDYPDTTIAKHALFNAGNIAWYRLGDRQRGESYFRELVSRFPGDPLSESALATLEEGVSQGAISAVRAAENESHVFGLRECYPNPFNPATTIRFDLAEQSQVSLVVYDILGRQVIELERGFREAGQHSVTWNAANAASGIYFARFNVTSQEGKGVYSQIVKLLLMK